MSNIPKLRFSEFKDEWKEKPLGSICSGISSGKDKNDINGAFDLYGSTGIIGKTSTDTFNGDFILAARVGANAGLLTRASGKFGVTDNTLVLFLKKDEEIDFIYYSLDKAGLNKMVFGSGQPLITGKQLKSLEISMPENLEQQKIANCLTSIDTLITAQIQKLDMLKAHKKGLMQQLFPATGETVPKLRFPEFRDAGDWEETILDSLINLQSGYAFQSKFFNEKGKKLLIPKNFTKSGRARFTKTNTKYTNQESDSKYICRKGDLLLLLTDLTPACELLGKPLLLNKTDGEVLLNQRIAKVLLKSEIKIPFLLYFFLTETFHRRIKSTASGSTVRHSSNKIILDTKLCIPHPKEQQKIANCLASLDQLITTQTNKVKNLKAHKQGLMQQLFPIMESN